MRLVLELGAVRATAPGERDTEHCAPTASTKGGISWGPFDSAPSKPSQENFSFQESGGVLSITAKKKPHPTS